MADKKQLGLFWGKDALYCIEIAGTVINQLFAIPIPETFSYDVDQNAAASQNAALAGQIKNAFKQYNVNAGLVSLSLPVRDIIFRTFIIPWMQSNEVKGVVEFEARKYIPFALEELNFSYHASNIIQDGARKIRIIFIAIKKESLENYTTVFDELGIVVAKIEPAPFSVLRALTFKNMLPQDQDVAVIEKATESGKIIIVDKGIPQFVREFQLRISSAQKDGEVDEGMLMTRLVNEIRVSLDYFNRQNNQFTVDQLLLISLKEGGAFGKRLEEDLRLQVTAIDCQQIFDNVAVDNIGYLNAFGASLAGAVSSPINLDLGSKKMKKARSMRPSLGKGDLNLKSVFVVFLLCVGTFVASFFLGTENSGSIRQDINKIEGGFGEYKTMAVKTLKGKNVEINERINLYSDLPTGSEVTYFLVQLTNLLPDGVWIDTVNFSYAKGYANFVQPAAQAPVLKTTRRGRSAPAPSQKVKVDTLNEFGLIIEIKGYAYMTNINEQFKLVNDLLINIKKREDFSKFFKNIELKTVKSQTLGAYNVTYYEIRCQ